MTFTFRAFRMQNPASQSANHERYTFISVDTFCNLCILFTSPLTLMSLRPDPALHAYKQRINNPQNWSLNTQPLRNSQWLTYNIFQLNIITLEDILAHTRHEVGARFIDICKTFYEGFCGGFEGQGMLIGLSDGDYFGHYGVKKGLD